MYDWQHNIGSTAIAIVMSLLQCASSDQEVRDMADLLLESFSFLYDNLDSSRPEKVPQSNLMRQLLNSAHLQYVNGAMSHVHAVCPPLYNYCGVIGLCGAAVCSISRQIIF